MSSPVATNKATPPVGDTHGQPVPRRGGTSVGLAAAIPSVETKLLKIFIGVSLAAHAFVILFQGWKFSTRKVTMEEETEIAADLMQDFEMTAPPVTAIPQAVKAPEAKVPENMLPQLTKNFQIVEPKKIEEPVAEEKVETKPVEAKVAPVEKKAEPAPETKPDEQKQELDKRDAMKRLALEALRQQQKTDKELKAPEADPLAQLAESMAKTGKLNKGPGKAALGTHAAKYMGLLREAIRSNYNLPEVYSLKGAGIKVQLAIEINDAGQVSSLKVQESSGDPAFDSLTMDAVRASVPLPKPPPDLVGQTILVNITPQGG